LAAGTPAEENILATTSFKRGADCRDALPCSVLRDSEWMPRGHHLASSQQPFAAMTGRGSQKKRCAIEWISDVAHDILMTMMMITFRDRRDPYYFCTCNFFGSD